MIGIGAGRMTAAQRSGSVSGMSRTRPFSWQSAVHALEDVLYPPACPLCGRPDPSGRDLCSDCQAALARSRGVPFCTRCGTTVGPFAGTVDGCPSCRTRPAPTAGFVRVGEFSGALAELIRAFKFQGRDDLEQPLGELLGDALRSAPWLPGIDVLTWVPTCWQHRLTRRMHATTALAPHAARRAERPLRKLLRRVRAGRHQVGLPRLERMENIRGCFRIVRGVRLEHAVIGLLDDVATTGATVFECARVLKRAGARRVYVGILAHAGGLPELPRDV